MERVEYSDIRAQIQTGDVIAFGGRGFLSDGIKTFTSSTVSHIGIIIKTEIIAGEFSNGTILFCVEATSLDGFRGVVINQLSRRIEHYDGDIWWLPLDHTIRTQLKTDVFVDFLLRQDHKPYDYLQAIKVPFFHQQEDWSRWFCSELIAAGYEVGGILPNINASIITPQQLCMAMIFDTLYYQIKGTQKCIEDYNNVPIDEWCRRVQE